ncbi:MAG: TadE/TadG family type IV pilus assembly protein [Myxococcota bacterium]
MYVEFLVVLMPLLTLWLGMLQLALLYIGQLVVQHASVTACRAAIVVLDDDPGDYGADAPERGKLVQEGESSEPGMLEQIGSMGQEVGGDLGGMGSAEQTSSGSGGPRLSSIRKAAYWPLLAISPEPRQVWPKVDFGDPSNGFFGVRHRQSMGRAIGDDGWQRFALGLILYNSAFSAVTFPEEPGSDTFRSEVGPNELVTVRVSYLFHCAVPLVSRFMCDSYAELALGLPLEAYGGVIDDVRNGDVDPSTARRWREDFEQADETSEQRDAVAAELEEAEQPGMQMLGLLGGRFQALRAEATMPNQGAPYKYQSELEDDSSSSGSASP